MSEEPRESARCPTCRLMQFVNESKSCKRCKEDLFPAPEPEKTKPAPRAQLPQEIADAFPVAIKQLRNERAWAQSDLAAKSNWMRTYISKVENGKSVPTLESIVRFAAAFGMKMSELIQRVESIAEGYQHEQD